MQPDSLIRETKSVCPECLKELRALILEIDNKVYLSKECPSHGKFQLLLSNHPWYYRQLNDFYFSLIKQSFPQRDYIVHLTNKCNLGCPICLANANLSKAGDYPLDELKKFIKGKKNFKIDLMGAEPTMRQDLPQIIEIVKRSGNIAALHTNGIKIADFNYLKALKKAGLDEVHFQFDGFDESAYEAIRGARLLEVKLRALENLEKLNISTDLKVTIVRNINEGQISKIIDFASAHKFIKEVFFLGCRYLGKAKHLSFENCLMPDELIDMLEQQTGGKISRKNIFMFQKLYFGLLAAFSIKKCFYNQHFLITRHKGGYIPVDKIIDLEGFQESLDRLKNSASPRGKFFVFRLRVCLIFNMLRLKNLTRIKSFLPMACSFIRGFNLSRLSGKAVLLGFISACDAYSYDYQVAGNCGKGAVSVDLGAQDTGAWDNIMRNNTKIPLSPERKLNENPCTCK